MFLPRIKAVCDGLTSLPAILVNLLTTTFVNILKLTLSKHIGWNCLVCVTSFYFGSSAMILKSRLNRGNFPSYKSLNKAIKSTLIVSQKI
jgi:hypothetical protein